MSRPKVITFNKLLDVFDITDRVLRRRAADAVNNALVIRNWLWGRYIVEYEQEGCDRARYGDKLVRGIASGLAERGLKGCSYRSLQLFKRFYVGYSEIVGTVSPQPAAPTTDRIVQTPSAQLINGPAATRMHEDVLNILSTRFGLSWSHYAFLVQIEGALGRVFSLRLARSVSRSMMNISMSISCSTIASFGAMSLSISR